MLPTKISFSLVYLGHRGDREHMAFFQVHSIDPRIPPGSPRWVAQNGWTIMRLESSTPSFIEHSTQRIYLTGGLYAPHAFVFYARSEVAAHAILQEVVDALRDWAEHYPAFSTPALVGSDVSPEVRDSLLELDDPVEDDETPRAPIAFDIFNPPRIAFA